MNRLKLMGEFLDAIKSGFKQTPPAVQGKIPQGFTLESYEEAVKLGLFDNGAPPSEVLEMMRQNGTVGRIDSLQYSDGTSYIDRLRAGRNEKVNGMNNMEQDSFTDIFPRYQDNFQFNNGIPSNFRVRKDPDGFRSDAAMNYRDRELMQIPINKSEYNGGMNKPDVARMNMYGNGDFMDASSGSQGLLGKQPQYVRGNEFPNDEYIMDPALKIRQAMRDGNIDVLDNVDGQLAGAGRWYDGKDDVKNLMDININPADNWDSIGINESDAWEELRRLKGK
tara:strand:- start:475 stop:1311 length:837 start_codon:yes stop_codon:yes gene_type:complete